MATLPQQAGDNDHNSGEQRDGSSTLLGAGSIGEGGVDDDADDNNNNSHNIGDVASAIKEATNVAERAAAVAADLSQTLASKQEEGGEVEGRNSMPHNKNNDDDAVPNSTTDGDTHPSLSEQNPAADPEAATDSLCDVRRHPGPECRHVPRLCLPL